MNAARSQNPVYVVALTVGLLGALGYALHLLPDGLTLRLEGVVARRSVVAQAMLRAAVIWLVIQVKSAAIQPFIYFQF